jgi:hypothetical protein
MVFPEDNEQLIFEYNLLKDQLDKVREQVDLYQKEIGNRCLDQPSKILATPHGAFKARWSPERKTYNRDDLAKAVYRQASLGVTQATPDGEIVMEPEQRVFFAFKECFRLEPKTTGLKKFGIELDEYVEKTSGEGYWTAQKL